MKGKRGDGILGGLFLVVLGGLFLASNLGLIQLRWEVVWPVILIFIGALWVLRALVSRNDRPM
jgi:hypothetical protein